MSNITKFDIEKIIDGCASEAYRYNCIDCTATKEECIEIIIEKLEIIRLKRGTMEKGNEND